MSTTPPPSDFYDDSPYGIEAVYADVTTTPDVAGINFEFGGEFIDDPGSHPKVVFQPSRDEAPEGPRTDSTVEQPLWQRATTDQPVRIDGANRKPGGTLVYVPAVENGPPIVVAHAAIKGAENVFRLELLNVPRDGRFSSVFDQGPVPDQNAVRERITAPLPALLVHLPLDRSGRLIVRRSEAIQAIHDNEIASRLVRVSGPGDGDDPIGLSPLRRYKAYDTRLQGCTLALFEQNQTRLDKLLNLMWAVLRERYQASFEPREPVPMARQSAQASWGYTWSFVIRVPIYRVQRSVQILSTQAGGRMIPPGGTPDAADTDTV